MKSGPETLLMQRPALTLTRKDRAMATPEYLGEEWRTIQDAHNYAISNHGRVKRLTDGPATYAGRIMSLATANGYKQVSLFVNGRSISPKVHVLVAKAFHGPKPSVFHQVAHRDGNRTNNRAGNLRWATPVENSADDIANGVRPSGERHPLARLTEDDVRAIRRGYTAFIAGLASQYGLKPGSIRGIIAGATWRERPHRQPPDWSAD